MIKVGDKVQYYCLTQCTLREGTVTAVDVEVKWLWHWEAHGTVMQSRHHEKGATHPLGVEINGTLTRAYYGAGNGKIGEYDKTRIAC